MLARDSTETHQSPPSELLTALPENGSQPPLQAAEARDLTERIRTAAKEICLLLLEAHQRRAWIPLGYRSWTEYVHCELAMSRSRSYELLDQARVVRIIQHEAGITAFPNVSAFVASQLRPYLEEVTAAIRLRAGGLPEDGATEVVNEVVQELKERLAGERTRSRGSRSPIDLARLRRAIQRLANMPPPRVVVAGIPETDIHRLAALPQALRRLIDMAARAEPDGTAGSPERTPG